MGIVWSIIIGFVVGALAKVVHPGRDNLGFIMTTLLGIAGAIIMGFLGQAVGWYQPGEPAGFIASIVGAVILLAIYARTRQAA
jgi:uncharacterized membrane protein YeaQ/YmgE (transglycosylase-associated protein family)